MSEDKKAKRQRVVVADEDRRTVFIAGLPESASERELKLFFAFAAGFIKVHRQAGTQPIGFALFDTQANALDAIARIQGYAWEEGQSLRAELAKGNLHALPGEGAEYSGPHAHAAAVPWPTELVSSVPPADPYSASRYSAPPAAVAHHSSYPPAPYQPPAYQPPAYQPPAYQPAPYQPPAAHPYSPAPSPYYPPYQPPAAQPAAAEAWIPGPAPKGSTGVKNPACDTLVLWGVKSEEAELLPILQPLGITNTKWTGKQGQYAVWVQFLTVEHATAALPVLHGYNGIRAEFSKNPLNKK